MEDCTGKSTSCESIRGSADRHGDDYAGLYPSPGASHGGSDVPLDPQLTNLTPFAASALPSTAAGRPRRFVTSSAGEKADAGRLFAHRNATDGACLSKTLPSNAAVIFLRRTAGNEKGRIVVSLMVSVAALMCAKGSIHQVSAGQRGKQNDI